MKTLIIGLLTCFFTISCSRNSNADDSAQNYNPQLPASTTSGANTFGCKINGIVMVPRNSIGYIPPGSNHYPFGYYRGTNYEYEGLGGGDLRPETNRGSISIYFQNTNNLPTELGKHKIYNGILHNGYNQNYNDNIFITINSKDYISIEGHGEIFILKSDANIIAGTFNCRAKNINDANDIIEISEGRFDINKSTINNTNFP